MTHHCVPALTLLGGLFAATTACAQSVGPVEAVGPDGAVVQPVVQPVPLTPLQRNALYNTASRQHVQANAGEITAAVGAAVPPSLALGNLPDVPTLGNDPDNVLKYATVEGDVVVVDPIRMRVVEVIHPGAGPQ
jgi:hypothetical protein